VSLRDTFLFKNAAWLSAGMLLTFLSSFGQTFFISIFAGEIRTEFGLSHGAWGSIYSLGTAVSAGVMIWAGSLTDVFRVRVLGPVILVGLACACLSMAFASVVWMLPFVIFALRFTGQGMTSHIAMVAMARWFVATRGKALSIATLGFAIGEAVLPVAFVTLLVFFDWRVLWLVAALIALAGVPILAKLLKQERTPQDMIAENPSPGMLNRHWQRAEALRHPLFWFMVPALLGPAAFNTAFFFHQVHFAEIKGWRHIELVAWFPLYTAISVGAMIAAGWALDRIGTARLMPFFQLPMVISFLAFAWMSDPTLAFVGFFFLALTTGANSTLPNAFWAEFYGTAHIGSIKALAAAVMVFGSAIGPGITGIMIDLGVSLETQFIGIAAYFLFTTLMMWIGIARARSDLPVYL
jgi:MFS family permease